MILSPEPESAIAQGESGQTGNITFRVPREIWRIIFEPLAEEPPRWLAMMSTLCKFLHAEVEAILYRKVNIETYAGAGLPFCKAVIRCPHRALAVRELDIELWEPWASLGHLARALDAVVNLQVLTIRVEEDALRLLLNVPFRLRVLHLICETAPAFVEDILARQPGLQELGVYLRSLDPRVIEHSDRPDQDEHVTISRTDILSQLRILHVLTDQFPLGSILHPYHVTHLSFGTAHHDDIAHALALFCDQLVALKVGRCIDYNCTDACFWPASMFVGIGRPLLRLQYVEVQDELDWNMDIYPDGELYIPSGATSCPAIKALIWLPYGVDLEMLEDLAVDERKSLRFYAQNLFSSWTGLERFVTVQLEDLDQVTLPGMPPDTGEGVLCKTYDVPRGFERGEDGSMVGPRATPFSLQEWRDYPRM
ncbi:hypothetical protein GY45DRAFT_1328029 [Cubamyces sp. BRFM 1775]|nr:hypothetical protein GY45DRAFT_1328029 [Cubamyces sp. BRFM 1775]